MSSFQSRSIFKNAYRSDIIRLILICAGLFVFLWFIEITFLMTEAGKDFFLRYMKQPLQLPYEFNSFLEQPWSLLTFGFMESNVWALFTNMVWLWIFGTVIEDLRGTNRVLPIFWFGFLFAGVVLLAVSYFYPLADGLYMGTLAGVAAVAVASITYKPRYAFYKIFGASVPIYMFGVIFILLTFLVRGLDTVHILVFASGAVMGFLSQNIFFSFFDGFGNALARSRRFLSSNENFIKKSARKTEAFNGLAENEKIRAIQHKINTQGLESVTETELEFLKKYEP